MKISLSETFQQNADFARITDEKFSLPAVEFETACDVHGISGNYKMPYDLTNHNLESALRLTFFNDQAFEQRNSAETVAELARIWDDIVALNPTLKVINPKDHWWSYINAILGATSGFNEDDIKFFTRMDECNAGPIAQAAYYHPNYAKVENSIIQRTPETLHWVASPATLVKIYDQVKDRPILHPDVEISGWPERDSDYAIEILQEMPYAARVLLRFPISFKVP